MGSRTVSIGAQNFETLILKNNFYIDKTGFIKEWWESDDEVTLITRPRRFGKTLNMSMLKYFFGIQYQDRGELFENLDIWAEEKYRNLQGTYPVIFLSFTGVKSDNYQDARKQIFQIIESIYTEYKYVTQSDVLEENEKKYCDRIGKDMDISDAVIALQRMCGYLNRYYGKKPIILLDEYDTPLQEAYANGYWKELVSFTRNFFNNTFKTNLYFERAVMTGITRVSNTSYEVSESMFSDLNNLKVVTITSDKYASYFGFTEAEVFAAMDEFNLENKEEVKRWYDGFTIGNLRDIYNPWSIISFLDKKELKPYWTNTSSNKMLSSLLQRASKNIKMQFEDLMRHQSIVCEMDEEIIFDWLDGDEMSVWSLLLASGYVKVLRVDGEQYELALTNYEVEKMFSKMFKTWFRKDVTSYSEFITALMLGDMENMEIYMNRVALIVFSYFDGGNQVSENTEPERFYHGFVLGLLVELEGRYIITSNRESGFCRYDVLMQPLNPEDDGIILEFKVHNPRREKSLEETVQAALKQLSEKQYQQTLLDQGIDREHIRQYGFAFEGKRVMIGSI